MKLSIGGFSFNNMRLEGKMDIFSYIDTVHARYQLHAIDFWNAFFADISRPLWRVADDDLLRRIRDALKEREMTLVNIAVDSAHLWDPDPEVREALHQNALSYLRAAEILEAKSVRLDAVLHGDGKLSDEALAYIAARYREYADRAADGGYWVGPENHTGLALQPASLVRISEAVDHPHYGILLHLGRWQTRGVSFGHRKPSAEDAAQLAMEADRQVSRWVRHTHVDNRLIEAENAVERISSLLQAGYDGYWAIEHNADNDPLSAVGGALNKLRHHVAAACQNENNSEHTSD
ncbi:sugar phosphate isomerase/epimerase family protein [Paenibacillus apiarius]|uniref:Sugar phosphate isomerase/epimerase n=1 Tax=Paenibacillus apiarius TaxID=46240 RepID=A0ABT4DNI2_9BACL|nr:TIM barrel protein [Paenibacillus apiarius]MCY9515511.1 sugar phosphate isomerase/epimerase [Paenibacillus apiarius]MCY9518920.1 sugar phosphate isomerase/epimerase [Paenibacillus apiarius]MCY9552034.1 sugar phosphate isomerase/epimerase [Paenibacillus apiarius]MCY9557290.1 sugar phosphate isomerase/epimerase [Paenibacillus apiarius]MCY9682531.1 sugar phosphate isomerase/epimerase [Paenibacillus apiarius]